MALAAALLLPLPGDGARLLAQTFRASVDLIAVDVFVSNRGGEVLPDLGADRFEVTIDGRRRRVVSATLTQHAIAPPPEPLATPRATLDRGDVSPVAASGMGGPRTFIITIDTASFRTLDVNVAVLAAQRFVSRLAPDDQVAVYTLPNGPNVEATTSHATVRQTLGRIVGRKTPVTGEFGMSIEQVIDITATVSAQSILSSRRSVGEMFAEESVSGDQISCQGPTALCTESAIAEAETLAYRFEEEMLQGLGRLDSLLRLLQSWPGRKTVLLLSGGMPVSDRSSGRPRLTTEVKQLGEQATYANATIHTLYFDQELNASFSLETRKPRASSARTRGIYTRALAEFSEPSGGTLLGVSTGAGESEIDRLLTQMSSYYVLGVEPEDRDRDGRPHRLSVKVSERGARVRHRQLVLVPRPK
jgi:VWFA-related protein